MTLTPSRSPSAELTATVLQVVPALNEGGAEQTTVEITRAITAAGGRALVATSGGRLCKDVEAAGGEIITLPLASKNLLTMLANRRALIGVIRANRVDIIHARSRAPAWSALRAARATGIPFIATYHGAYRAGNPLKRFYNSVMARGDLVIANSEFTAGAIRRDFKVSEKNLRVIPRGADLARFNPAAVGEERIARLAAAWELPGAGENKGLIGLMPGRLTEWKGHQVAVDALARLAACDATGGLSGLGADFRLVFVGDPKGGGAFAAALARGIEELGLNSLIRMVGHCDDMPAAYALADMVLSPSTRPEAFGRVAAEAGAMGRVAIAADHGGARETVKPGETGFLTAPGDRNALAEAMVEAANMGPDGRAAMGEKARRHIGENYSIAAMGAATINAYRDVLGEGRLSDGV